MNLQTGRVGMTDELTNDRTAICHMIYSTLSHDFSCLSHHFTTVMLMYVSTLYTSAPHHTSFMKFFMNMSLRNST